MILRPAISVLLLAAACTVSAGTPQPPSPAPPSPTSPHNQTPAGLSEPPPDLEHAMAVGPHGTLAVRALQGTRGGPAVGSDEIEVFLVHRGEAIKHIKSRLDDTGLAMLADLPIAIGVQPIVQIRHAGVLYQESGPTMDANTTRASMNITVYEVTDQAPQWKVISRQLMAARLPDSMDVAELVTVENLGDKTWLGAPPNEQNRRDTVVLGVADRAENFNLEAGFHGWCCTSAVVGGLHVQMPLMPGRMTYQFSYNVPITDGKADLRISASAVTDQALIVIPDDGSAAQATLLQPSGTDTIQGTRVRLFKALTVPSGQQASVLLTGLLVPKAPSEPPPSPVATTFPINWAIGSSAGAVATFGVLMWLRIQRRPRMRKG